MVVLRKFFKDNLIFGLASVMAGFFNYLYHVVLAHVLGPTPYGDLTTFLNVTAFLVIPASVVTLVYTRLGKRPQGPQAQRESIYLWGSAALLWGLVWAFNRPLSQILHVSGPLLVIYTAEVLPSLALAANLGILQRARWYVYAGLLGVVNTGFRVVAAAGAAWSGYRLEAVGILEGVAAWVTWGGSRYLASRVQETGESTNAKVISGTALVGVINVLLGLSDGLLAKHALTGAVAGRYNGLATIGHSLQFMSQSIGTVMLTAIISDFAHRRRYLWITVVVYATLVGVGEGFFMARGNWIVITILGHRFLPIVTFLPYYGWGMASLGLNNIVMLYSVALKRWEVVVGSGIGLLYWIWQMTQLHHFSSFVYVTAQTQMVLAVLAVFVTLVGAVVRNRTAD